MTGVHRIYQRLAAVPAKNPVALILKARRSTGVNVNVRFPPLADIPFPTQSGHVGCPRNETLLKGLHLHILDIMTQRQFYPYNNNTEDGLPSREVWRLRFGGGRVIVFETMEEVYFEHRSPPYGERTEVLPILRAIFEGDTMVHVFPKTWTLVLEGFTQHGGGAVETAELVIDDNAMGFRDIVGHRFDSAVKSVRVAGMWSETKG